MTTPTARFDSAMARFDAVNAADPRGVELVYGQRMSDWLTRLYPEASEPLRLAARAHTRRWEIPRSNFPMDRIGYHRWRTTLYTFHGDVAEKILREAGYDDALIARVRSLLRKERLKSDAEVQALEDAACLVFLENYFAEFADKHDEEKVIGILRKTWAKMSAKAHAAALKLQLPEGAKRLVERALDLQ